MPQFTPKVTELVLAELFFLSIDRANQPINVYVHSFGTQTPNKQVRSADGQWADAGAVRRAQAVSGVGGTCISGHAGRGRTCWTQLSMRR